MGAWNPFSASDSYTSASNNTQQNSQTTPIIDPTYSTAYSNLIGSVNPAGATPGQAQAMNFAAGQVGTNPVNTGAEATNAMDYILGGNFNTLNSGTLSPISTQNAPQITSTPQSSGTSQVTAPTGASMTGPYAALYSQALIDPSLKAFDYGSQVQNAATNAQLAGAGGFANSRSGVVESNLAAQDAVNRGNLAAGLLTTGLTNATNLGQQDASRSLLGQTTNAANTLNNNQFNTGLLQQTNALNLGAQQTNTAQQLQAASQISQNLAAGAGLSQDILANIVTANGVNTSAAQTLFNEGSITSQQLAAIVAAASQFNGSAFNLTQNSSGDSNTAKVSIGG